MPSVTIQQAFNQAVQQHEAGRLRDAEALYRQILAQHPEHTGAIHLLGVIALQTGRNEIAVDLIRQAIARKPDFSQAHNNLGVALKQAGQIDLAIDAFRRAIDLNPEFPDACNNLGNALKDKGQLEEAIAAYRRAIDLKPDCAEAYSNLCVALTEMGRLDDAIAACRKALALRPNYPEAHYNLGVVLQGKGRIDDAIEAYRMAISLKPNYAEAHNNLGVTLKESGRLDEAIASYRQAIAVRPNYAHAHNNLGNALKDKGALDDAIAEYRMAIAANPNFANAHFTLGLALLTKGEFHAGFAEHEWRWATAELAPFERNFAQPPWDGAPLEGRTILLHAEQGFGDTFQFIRYLPLVIGRGGNVILECEPELQRLLASQAEKCQIVTQGQPLPDFDFHCPLLSLPRVFGTTVASIPAAAHYLRADPADTEKWRRTMSDYSQSAKVGLVWAGRPAHKNDRNRSINLASFAPLARTPGVRLFSLQKGKATQQIATAGIELIDWTQELTDFADTAALIANLDLVIAVDTAIAHLAGAMGKPVWTLLPFASDWRWLWDREDSPWYPSMRLFRQASRGDWDSVIAKVADALCAWVKHRA